MSTETMLSVLGWCGVINVGVLLLWFLFFALAHDLMYRMHGKLFKLSVETFDALHYGLLAVYKLLIIVLIIAPYLAMRIAG